MTKVNNVRLQQLEFGTESIVFQIINDDTVLKNTFGGGRNTLSRVANSDYTALIKVGKKTVGFVMLVHNDITDKYEVDIGITKEHRGKGYGSKALEKLKLIIQNCNLDVKVQTRNINESAIKIILKNGFVLCDRDEEFSYYTLPIEDSQKQKR